MSAFFLQMSDKNVLYSSSDRREKASVTSSVSGEPPVFFQPGRAEHRVRGEGERKPKPSVKQKLDLVTKSCPPGSPCSSLFALHAQLLAKNFGQVPVLSRGQGKFGCSGYIGTGMLAFSWSGQA